MKYREKPDGSRYVEATLEEMHALRPCVCSALRRYGCPERDVDDLAQNVEIITWQALNEGRVQGHDLAEPRDALVMFMVCVARNRWNNHRRSAASRYEVFPDELPDVGASPVARMEARDILRRIGARPLVARFLLSAALQRPCSERCIDARMKPGTYEARLKKAQTWARKVARSGHWQEPRRFVLVRRWKRKR